MTAPATAPDSAPAIAVIPYAERLSEGLANLPLDRLDWPLGRPARLTRGTVADMAATDHLITYPKTSLYFAPRGVRRAQLSLMIVEPDVVHAKHLRLARLFHRRFFRVLTKNRALLAAIPNGRFLVFGSTFIREPERIDGIKTSSASLIASAKHDWEGHRLRHRIVETAADQALHRKQGVLGVGDGLALGTCSAEDFAVFGIGDDGGCGARALRVFDDLRLAAFHDGDAAVGGAEVDTDDLAHF
jgi:hypothetical protein